MGNPGNLYVGMPNEKLRECYNSYRRVLVNKRKETEIFDNMIDSYLPFIEVSDARKKKNIAFSIARDHMINVIARRYFKICDEFNDFEIHHDY